MSKSSDRFLSPSKEAQIKAVYESLSEKEQRRFAASMSLSLPRGGCRYVSQLLGCSRSTLTRGRNELKALERDGDPAEGRQRREGAGRPSTEDTDPELPDKLDEILQDRTAGDPKDETVKWTHLTFAEIGRRLSEFCGYVSWPVTKRLCLSRGLKKRRQVESVTQAPSRHRDEQFKIIDRLRATFRRTKDAIFSIDSKEKEMLGNVFREGEVLADGPVEVLDHCLPSYSDGQVITHGIYDTQHNSSHINLSLGHDTGAFSCHSFLWFWQNIGRLAHKAADRILLLFDCGGSNHFRSNIFKYNLCQLASTIDLPIRVAHFPVYCSKYNPIERRVFPYVERAYRGQIFTTAQQMADAIERRANTSTGLETTAHVLERRFKPATKKAKRKAAHVEVGHPERLNEYNYRATPEMLQ